MTPVIGALKQFYRVLHGFGSVGERGRGFYACCLRVLTMLLVADSCHAVQLIAHDSVPVAEVSVRELRAIYTLRLERWSNGETIQVFVLPQRSAAHQQFCKNILEVLPHQLQAVWYRLAYSGMGRAPTEVGTEQEMIERVRRTPGAIGYVENVSAVQDDGILKIELRP